MTGKKQKLNKSRRDFLHSSAIVGAGAVAASSFSGRAVASVNTNQVEQPVEEGYRLTRHILDYYKTAAD